METRRIGMQVNDMSMYAFFLFRTHFCPLKLIRPSWLRDQGRHLDDFDDRLDALDRLEHRMSRVVGVRRVE
jgi:hypothetical protein